MFLKGNILNKSQWMGIAAVFMAFVMALNPVPVLAEEGNSDDVIFFFDGDGNESTIGSTNGNTSSGNTSSGGVVEGRAAEIIGENEVWAFVDKEELRPLVDVDALREKIDVDAIRESIDREKLKAEIDGSALLKGISEEELKQEFVERKQKGEFFAIDEETIVLEDGREISSFKIKLPEQSEQDQSEEEKSVQNHPVDVTNVQLPVIGEDSPFDFIIDPLGLIYLTDAAKYGGGRVEEGATILFRNSEGEYDFSHKSDMLKVVNKSNIPVKLVITASISNPDAIAIVGSEYDLFGDQPSIYMALEDEDGVDTVITGDGEAVIETVLDAAADETYVYEYNTETGTYEYYMAEDAENTEFPSFSFGLTACSNTEANWDDVDVRPIVSVNWKFEPVLTDWDLLFAEQDAEEYAAFKLVKLNELVDARLEELLEEKVEELKELELQQLIEDELLILAGEKLAEIHAETGEEAIEETGTGAGNDTGVETGAGSGTDTGAESVIDNAVGNTVGDIGGDTQPEVIGDEVIIIEDGAVPEAASVLGASREEVFFFETPDENGDF